MMSETPATPEVDIEVRFETVARSIEQAQIELQNLLNLDPSLELNPATDDPRIIAPHVRLSFPEGTPAEYEPTAQEAILSAIRHTHSAAGCLLEWIDRYREYTCYP